VSTFRAEVTKQGSEGLIYMIGVVEVGSLLGYSAV
jgi:hypothetical protein